MDPTILAQLFVFGLLLGSVYGLVALGLTMIWGVMGVINIAHGSLMVVGMYTVWFAIERMGLAPLLAIPLGGLVLVPVGLIMFRTSVEPVVEAPDNNHLIATLGWLLILVATLQIVFSPTPRALDLDLGAGEFVGVFVPYARLLGLAVTLCTVVGMFLFLQYTRLGRAIRATADNRQSARYLGLNIRRIDHITFGIGAGLAGIAGAVIPFIQRFDPYLGDFYLTTAFVVAVLGGLGSFHGALMGGLLIGMVHVFGAFYLPGTWNRVLIYLIFIGVLLVKPTGLFGGEISD